MIPNVVLTGFMGTGKSTVGRQLAQALGTSFVDTDSLIESRHGPIPAIFERSGESEFRELERQIIAEIVHTGPVVLATGGGVMLDERNAAALEAWGTVYTLIASPDEIIRRVTADGVADRPLLQGDDPAGAVTELLAERRGVYGRYSPVRTDGRDPVAIAQEIANDLENRGAFVNPHVAPSTSRNALRTAARGVGGCLLAGVVGLVALFVLLMVARVFLGFLLQF